MLISLMFAFKKGIFSKEIEMHNKIVDEAYTLKVPGAGSIAFALAEAYSNTLGGRLIPAPPCPIPGFPQILFDREKERFIKETMIAAVAASVSLGVVLDAMSRRHHGTGLAVFRVLGGQLLPDPLATEVAYRLGRFFSSADTEERSRWIVDNRPKALAAYHEEEVRAGFDCLRKTLSAH